MIKQISFSEVEPYEREMKRAMLTLTKIDYLYGKYLDNQLVGWAGVKSTRLKYIYKTAFVLEPFRRQGVYKQLIDYRLMNHSDKPIEAVCTPMSYKLYEKAGFQLVKTYKNKCRKVIKK